MDVNELIEKIEKYNSFNNFIRDVELLKLLYLEHNKIYKDLGCYKCNNIVKLMLKNIYRYANRKQKF